MRDRASRVHLFKRRSAILCAYQYQKHQWVVSAADAEAADTTLATDKEVDLLLRAWLSPVPPPAAEQLSDLV